MDIYVDSHFMCPFIKLTKHIEHEEEQVLIYEIGDEIFLYKGVGKCIILNITSNVVIVHDYDNNVPIVIKMSDFIGYVE